MSRRRSVFRLVLVSLAGISALILSGCAATQETTTLRQDVYLVQKDVQDIYRRLDKLEQLVQGKEDRQGSGAMSMADINARVEELRVQMGRLNGRLEEQQHKLQQLQASGSASSPASASPPTPSAGPELSSAPGSGASPSPVITIPKQEDPEKTAYQAAFDSYRKGQYQNARQQFQAFLKDYPRSSLADNALFYAGECYYSEKEYQKAIETYQQVLDQYPKGNKVPDAMLKQATAFQQLNDQMAARILYERLTEKYPESAQAQIAKEKLKSLQ